MPSKEGVLFWDATSILQNPCIPEKYQHLVSDEPENMCRGGSIIVSPLGKILAGPLFDKAGALMAEIDLEEINQSKLDFDVIGHYSRDDIFKYEASQSARNKNRETR